MIPFTVKEILISILSATVYGLFFAFSTLFIDLIKCCIARLLYLVMRWLKLEKRTSADIKESLKFGKCGGVVVFIRVLLFFIGFTVISYAFLDGCIRLYMIVFSVLGASLGRRAIKFIVKLFTSADRRFRKR